MFDFFLRDTYDVYVCLDYKTNSSPSSSLRRRSWHTNKFVPKRTAVVYVTVISFAQPCVSDSQNIDAFFSDMFTERYSFSCNRSGINQMQTDGFICYVPVVVISRYFNQVVLIYTSKLSALLEFMPPSTHCLDMSKEFASSFCSSSDVNILSLSKQKLAR